MFLSRNYMKSMHLCIVGNTHLGKTIPLRVYNLIKETRKQNRTEDNLWK